jgi:hypothetical protein
MSMAVGTQLNTFHDASGLVTVAVFEHRASPEQEIFLNEKVDVADGDMVAIGGGGVASDGFENTTSTPGGPGALLTASFPSGDFTGWIVQSRDHESPQTYSLVSYVIGMKIAGMSRNQLIDSISIQTDISSNGNHIEQEVGVTSAEFVLIGGGFQVDVNRFNLATASFPSSEFSWKARSQDHHIASPASIRVFAISIKRRLPVGLVTARIFEADGGQAPHPASSSSLPNDLALTGGGAEVIQVNNGNFLWKLQPATFHDPSFTAASKDHITPAPCPIRTFALGIRIN